MLRNSERSTAKRCEFLWELTYVRRLKPDSTMPALRFGTLVHKALADYYIPGVKRGEHPARAYERHYEADLKENETLFGMRVGDDEKWADAAELGVAMLENYVDEYGKDEQWEVLVTEQPFRYLVTRRTQTPPKSKAEADAWRKNGIPREPWFYATGVLDGIWRNRSTKEIWIPDHKTIDGLSKDGRGLRYLALDDQAGMYWSYGVDWLYQEGFLKPNQKLNGMLYNFLRKSFPDQRPSRIEKGQRLYLNKDGSVSKAQPSPYFLRKPVLRDHYDREEAKRRIAIDFQRQEALRSGQLEVSKNPGRWTCPMCPMFDTCELHETGGDYEAFIKQTTTQWDPYAEHEIYAGR